ncbi:MAG TPA: ABC transporter ATP-binding protein [Chloroflexota bacterium]|nr:ABC transporter ATP-binding protein [Chloroflexota bacterium]
MIRLYRFLRPFSVALTASVLLIFLQSISQLYLPTLMADIVDTGIARKNVGYIISTGEVMLLITVGGMIASIVAAFLSSRVAVGFGRDVRAKLFARVESFSLHEFDRFGTATLITRTTNDVTQVQMVTLIIIRMMVAAPIMAIGGIIMALRQDRPLTLVLAVALPVLVAVIVLTARLAIPLFRLMQTKLDRLNLVMREGLTGIRVIRAFNRVDYQAHRFDDANADVMDNAIRANRIVAFLMPSMMLIMNLTSVAILWFGAIRINSGGMEVGSLIAFTQYSMQIMFSFLMVSMLFVMVPRAAASADRINAVLDTQPEITDPVHPVEPGSASSPWIVEFRDVTFRYPGAEQPALSHISFGAGRGEVTAIIGGTGAGKSTLTKLIPRFYDVDSGAVLVDGTDVREMTQHALRERISLVPQQTVLFSGTIADNIRFGNQDATGDDLRRATEIAQAAEFISDLSGGLAAAVAQGGSNFSGGQKQRLSIARAVVRRPEIYIFDDSFSALDFKTDARVRAALRRETADSTVLIVAQRVATVMDADRIIVLDEGRIAGIGTHRELMRTSEVYREVVASQLSPEEVA